MRLIGRTVLTEANSATFSGTKPVSGAIELPYGTSSAMVRVYSNAGERLRGLPGDHPQLAGQTGATGQTGAVTLIRRFGSALNLNIHFHMLCLDGAYTLENGRPCFHRVPLPTPMELEVILTVITTRLARHLERRGLLVQQLRRLRRSGAGDRLEFYFCAGRGVFSRA